MHVGIGRLGINYNFTPCTHRSGGLCDPRLIDLRSMVTPMAGEITRLVEVEAFFGVAWRARRLLIPGGAFGLCSRFTQSAFSQSMNICCGRACSLAICRSTVLMARNRYPQE